MHIAKNLEQKGKKKKEFILNPGLDLLVKVGAVLMELGDVAWSSSTSTPPCGSAPSGYDVLPGSQLCARMPAPPDLQAWTSSVTEKVLTRHATCRAPAPCGWRQPKQPGLAHGLGVEMDVSHPSCRTGVTFQ